MSANTYPWPSSKPRKSICLVRSRMWRTGFSQKELVKRANTTRTSKWRVDLLRVSFCTSEQWCEMSLPPIATLRWRPKRRRQECLPLRFAKHLRIQICNVSHSYGTFGAFDAGFCLGRLGAFFIRYSIRSERPELLVFFGLTQATPAQFTLREFPILAPRAGHFYPCDKAYNSKSCHHNRERRPESLFITVAVVCLREVLLTLRFIWTNSHFHKNVKGSRRLA